MIILVKLNKLPWTSISLKAILKSVAHVQKKLWYKKQGYPTKNDDNEYLTYLAKGGCIVGKMAQLIYEGESTSLAYLIREKKGTWLEINSFKTSGFILSSNY